MKREVEIAEALKRIRTEIPSDVRLIVVTKTFPVSDIEILYRLGERDFGENRVDEGAEKSLKLPEDAIWHFQGNIQSNKIRSIVSWAEYIHSLDNLRHATKIAEVARSLGKRQKVFIQVNLDLRDLPLKSEKRGGIDPGQFESIADSLLELSELEVVGVMGVAPLGEEPAPAFARLLEISHALQKKSATARFISAGMSGDFRTALAFGATHIRIGSSILGSR